MFGVSGILPCTVSFGKVCTVLVLLKEEHKTFVVDDAMPPLLMIRMSKLHRVVISALKLSCTYVLVVGDDASGVVMVGLTDVVGVAETGCVIIPLVESTMKVRNMW